MLRKDDDRPARLIGSLRNRTAGRLKTAELRKMLRETEHSQSYATSFPHFAVLSVPVVLLRKLPNFM